MTLDGRSTRTAAEAGLGIDTQAEPLAGVKATVAQLTLETPFDAALALLPQALHPINPAVLVITAFSFPDSTWGAYTSVEVALQCRAGARARRFLIGHVVNKQEVADAMRNSWGVAARVADVQLEERYEGVTISVTADEGTVLRARMVDKDPIAPSAVAFFAALALSRIDGEDKLVQLERDFELYRGDRGRPKVDVLDSGWWTEGESTELRATMPISAATLRADVALKPVRFLIDPSRAGALGISRIDTVPAQ